MGRVRPLGQADIVQIAELYRRVFGSASAAPPGWLEDALHAVLWDHPWRDDALPSLVYEDEHGRVVGCIGVMPRPMSIAGEPVRAVVSHTVMIEPGRRAAPVSVELLKALLSGPQDLILAQGAHVSRRIFEAIGGVPSPFYGVRWVRPLRPARYVLSSLRRRGLPALPASALTPFCRALDTLAARVRTNPFRVPPSDLGGDELDVDTFVESLDDVAHDRSLRPRYDRNSAKWLLELMASKPGAGAFQKVVVRQPSGEVAGWYLYYLNPGGTSEVVQVGASAASVDAVLAHLFAHAWRGGAVALSGQLDPAAFPALTRGSCLFRHDGGPGLLVHSRRGDLREAIHRGDGFITRLEGEWWIGFLLT